MHGDFSLDNLIQTDKGLFFIDPIYNENQWSSYLLDISKLLHSYHRYNRMFEHEIFMNMWIDKNITSYRLKLLELTQFIRVLKYIPDDKVRKEFHEKSKTLIECLKK